MVKKRSQENKEKQLMEEIADVKNRLKRALADYDNLKKQTEKEKEEFSRFAGKVIIENLVGIWEGMEIVTSQLYSLLLSQGFEEIVVEEGGAFDPSYMEAVISEGDGEKVVGVMSKGFKLHGKIIKPVKVKVG